MKRILNHFIAVIITITLVSCQQKEKLSSMNILYLHHSTGGIIWLGKEASFFTKATRRISPKLANNIGTKAVLPELFKQYNLENKTNYTIEEMAFPKKSPYGWHNFPYDYYNIWVKNEGDVPFMKEPTLELLTKKYNVIIFKHCYPVSNIKPDLDSADINSDYKSLANYKLQYVALRDKLHEFPNTKFILFTGAAQVKSRIEEQEARRAKDFFSWVITEWDMPDDNIFIWDFYNIETEGELYLKEKYSVSTNNSHPNSKLAGKAVQLLFNRIVDVIENNGKGTSLVGEKIH